MASTPLWVPLTVAALGVAGTFGAAFFTRRWADRREDQRWSRDREAENTRWQREQGERREQWRREDRARWLAERRSLYAEFLLGLEIWKSALSKAEGEARQNGDLAEQTAAKLEDLDGESNRVYEVVSILAPREIVEIAAGCWLTLSLWTFGVTTGGGDGAVNNFSGKKNDYSGSFSKDYKRLRSAIRRDLGVDAGST